MKQPFGYRINYDELMLKNNYIVTNGHYPLYLDESGIDIIVGVLEEKKRKLKEEGNYSFEGMTEESSYAFSLESTLISARLLQEVFKCESDERKAIHSYIERFAPERQMIAEAEELEKTYSDSDEEEDV